MVNNDTEVNFESTNVQDLLDTGSPVTIAKFLFQTLAKHRLPDQTVEEWEESIRERFQYSSVKLKRGKLNIIGQTEVRLERCSNQTKAVVQNKNVAPVQLLIGIDLLSSLGVLFLLKEPKMSQSHQIQYDLVQDITLSLQANEFVPAIKEQSDIERREDLNMTEALKSTTIFKDSPDEKECDSAKVFCEVASYATTTTTTRKFKLSI